MLRRKLSSGLLRAASASASPAASGTSAAAALRHGASQNAGLVSAVLLPSQRSWREETVVSLKEELRRRGLSQTGNKATLVSRLSSADASAHLPAVPPLPKSKSAPTSAYASRARGVSTSAIASAKGGAGGSGSAKVPVGASAGGAESVTTTGPQVVSQRAEAPKKAEVKPEEVAVAPGLPELAKQAKEAKGAAGSMTPRIPLADLSDATVEQVIPLEPDNFRSTQHLPTEPPKAETPDLPKVLTVSSGPGAPGPSHAIHDHAHADTSASKRSENEDDSPPIDLPGLGEVLARVVRSPVDAVRALGLGLGGAPQEQKEGKEKKDKEEKKEPKEERYEASGRPLDGEERRGAWVLAGLVGAGLLLGGSKSGRGKGEGVVDKAKKAVGAGGVKGDANWEKASGAGVVGHGTRKA